MPLPEGYLPREGDILVIHVETQFNVEPGDRHVYVRLTGSNRYQKFGMPLTDVERLWSRHWEVGDEAQLIGKDHRHCDVLAVDGDAVWCKMIGSEPDHLTLHINQIEPRQPPPSDQTTDPGDIAALLEASEVCDDQIAAMEPPPRPVPTPADNVEKTDVPEF